MCCVSKQFSNSSSCWFALMSVCTAMSSCNFANLWNNNRMVNGFLHGKCASPNRAQSYSPDVCEKVRLSPIETIVCLVFFSFQPFRVKECGKGTPVCFFFCLSRPVRTSGVVDAYWASALVRYHSIQTNGTLPSSTSISRLDRIATRQLTPLSCQCRQREA